MSDENNQPSAGWIAMRDILSRVAVGPKGSRDKRRRGLSGSQDVPGKGQRHSNRRLFDRTSAEEKLWTKIEVSRALRDHSTIVQTPAANFIILRSIRRIQSDPSFRTCRCSRTWCMRTSNVRSRRVDDAP